MGRAEDIVAALGGRENVVGVQVCITRLRCDVADAAAVDQAALKGVSHGVLMTGSAVQIVVGAEPDELADQVRSLL